MANLITLREYKDFAGLTGVNEDSKINVIIPAISQAVKSYCGTTIIDYYSTDKTEYFDITDNLTYAIMVDESPLVSVSLVRERDSQSGDWVTLISENSDSSGKYEYLVDVSKDTIFRTTATGDKYFPKGRKAVEVTYEAAHCLYAGNMKKIGDGIWMGDFNNGEIELVPMPEEEAFDIDYEWEFELYEKLYMKKGDK